MEKLNSVINSLDTDQNNEISTNELLKAFENLSEQDFFNFKNINFENIADPELLKYKDNLTAVVWDLYLQVEKWELILDKQTQKNLKELFDLLGLEIIEQSIVQSMEYKDGKLIIDGITQPRIELTAEQLILQQQIKARQ